jgi:aldehyde dehydrogenase (NAD+)
MWVDRKHLFIGGEWVFAARRALDSGWRTAVAIANDSDYGLGGTVWSKDQERATQIARRVATGTIGVNGYVIDLAAPFGGIKQSGLGREFGPEALAGYQQLKSVYLPGYTG